MSNGIVGSVLEILHLDYALTSLLITYFAINNVRFLKNTTPKKKSLTAFVVSLVVGAVFWLIDSEFYTVTELIFSATVAVTLYEWFVKHVLSTFGIGTKKEKDKEKE